MKKFFLVFLASFALLFMFSGTVIAYGPGCTANNNTVDPAAWDAANNKPIGLVPCGISVDASNRVICPCELGHLFIMMLGISNFIMFMGPLIAGLMITIGGVMIILSGINPSWMNTGRTMILWSIIGVVVIFCAWIIVNALMTRVFGINNWNTLPFLGG